MTISHALAHTIIAYTKSGFSEQESIDKVCAFMDRRNLSGFKPAVLKYVKKILHANKEQNTVRLYTAHALDGEDREQILRSFPGDYSIEEIIDEACIGGFRAEHNYQYSDATIQTALTKLKQHLLHP